MGEELGPISRFASAGKPSGGIRFGGNPTWRRPWNEGDSGENRAELWPDSGLRSAVAERGEARAQLSFGSRPTYTRRDVTPTTANSLTANAKGAGRRLDFNVTLVLGARTESECAARTLNNNGAGTLVWIIDKLVESDL